MNKTKIEWCDSTWNPVTGCYHNCEYCYARKIANRFSGGYVSGGRDGLYCLSDKAAQYIIKPELSESRVLIAQHNPIFKNIGLLDREDRRYSPYPFGFCPTFHNQRLYEPRHKKKPQNIFVCSMADLFGEWVPDKWIQEVFEACAKADQHRYLFLTKNPLGYSRVFRSGLDYRINNWFGTTATDNKSFMENGFDLFEATGGNSYHHANRFLSIEPLHGEIKAKSLSNVDCLDWVIIGAETGNRKGKVIPEKEWIDSIVSECQKANVPVFMKESLLPIMGEENMKREFPDGLKL